MAGYLESMSKCRYKWLLVFLFVVFIAAQFTFMDRSDRLWSDECVYYYGARNLDTYHMLTYDRDGLIFSGKAPAVSASNTQPGYVFYLYLIFKAFGPNILLAKQLNVLLLGLLFFVVVRLLRELGCSRGVTLFTMLMYTLYPGWYYSTGKLLTEIPFTFLLVTAFFFFARFLRRQRLRDFVLFGVLLTLDGYIRGVALPVYVSLVTVYVLWSLIMQPSWEERKRAVLYAALAAGILAVMLLPWFVRNYLVLGKFVYNEASTNPIFWATMPYSIGALDVGGIPGLSWKELAADVMSYDPLAYLQWRLFGFIQFMWGDLWDEHLVHPFVVLRGLWWIHFVVVVPLVGSLGIFLIQARRNILLFLVACMPLLFSGLCLHFSALPRYVWPSMPFVFLSLGAGLQALRSCDIRSELRDFFSVCCPGVLIMRLAAGVLLAVTLYSVFIFPMKMDTEQSRFYQYIYKNRCYLPQTGDAPLLTVRYTEPGLDMEAQNFTQQDGVWRNDQQAAGIVRVHRIPLAGGADVVSEVELHFSGGYMVDYSIIYWRSATDKDFSEDRVYRVPHIRGEIRKRFVIPADVSELMIVPIVFWNGSLHFDDIVVRKYDIPASVPLVRDQPVILKERGL